MNRAPGFKPLRLTKYDYSRAGCYFITICVKDKQWILWDAPTVAANCVRPSPSKLRPFPFNVKPHQSEKHPPQSNICLQLSHIGLVVETEIEILSKTYEGIFVDKHVVMPNHIHMIIGIQNRRSQIAPTISNTVKQYKGSVTKKLGYSIWQKSFYDHIIRDDTDYRKIWNYIDTNPERWLEDKYYCN